jgi:hypothetical protein
MRRCQAFPTGGLLALLALLSGCGTGPTAVVTLPTTLDGAICDPMQVPAGELHVLLFLTTDCPIANSYAPEITTLARDWHDQPVRLYLVHVDPDITAALARKHAADYGLPPTIVLDPWHRLAGPLRIAATPEAVVLDHRGLQYRGRIDDAWRELGGRAMVPQHQELRAAVAALLHGQPVPVAHTEAIGCLLPEPRQ